MVALGVEKTDPMVGLGLFPRKQMKGKRHNSNKEILEDVNQLACDGWQSVPNLCHFGLQASVLAHRPKGYIVCGHWC
jgi:hypothetical protein